VISQKEKVSGAVLGPNFHIVETNPQEMKLPATNLIVPLLIV
jgi:hypothetical protein